MGLPSQQRNVTGDQTPDKGLHDDVISGDVIGSGDWLLGSTGAYNPLQVNKQAFPLHCLLAKLNEGSVTEILY